MASEELEEDEEKMSLSVGIVGLPNAGKSTLFNALMARQLAAVAAHPFTTIEPNTGVVAVPDGRLQKLTEALKPGKSTPATITFIDIAGLVKGAHEGEGLGNEFLSHILSTDAICHVLREFTDPNITHVSGEIDPIRDREIVETELRLKDLEILGRLRESKQSEPALRLVVEKYIEAINRGVSVSSVHLTQEEAEASRSIGVLCGKPVFYVLNVYEEDLTKRREQIETWKKELGATVVVSAKLEEELATVSEGERQEYRQVFNLSASALDQIIATAYNVLQLVTFYTVKGAEAGGPPSRKATEGQGEIRAWAVPKGTTALDAARRVHTDFAQRFVTAEVIGVDKLLEFGGFGAAKEKGKVRMEGREYAVQDGDVVEFVVG